MHRFPLAIVSALFVLALSGFKSYVIVAEPYPPYEYLVDGKPQGMDIEILTEAAKLASIELTFQFAPWARALTMVEKGEVDGIICLNRTPEREAFLFFPKTPLSMERLRVFSTKDSPDVKSIQELEGKTVGVVNEYEYGAAFDRNPKLTKDVSPDPEIMVKKLNARRFPYAVHNEVSMAYLLKSANASAKACTLVVQESPLYIGFSKKSPNGKEFFEKMAAALEKINASGRLSEIQNKYSK